MYPDSANLRPNQPQPGSLSTTPSVSSPIGEARTDQVASAILGSTAFTVTLESSSVSRSAEGLSVALRTIGEHALNVGLSQGRDYDPIVVETNKTTLNDYLASQRELLGHHGNRKVVEDLIDTERRRGIQLRLEADKVAMTVSVALRRFMPDTKTLFDVLSNRSPLENRLICEAFQSRYNQSIKSFIARTLSRRPGLSYFMPPKIVISMAHNMLDNNHLAATTDALAVLVSRFNGKRFEQALAIYLRSPAEILEKLPDEFEQRYRITLEEFFAKKLQFSAIEIQILASVRQKDAVGVATLGLLRELEKRKPNQVRICEILEAVPTDEFPSLLCRFQSYSKPATLPDRIRGLADSPLRERMCASLDHDSDALFIAKLRCAVRSIGDQSAAELLAGVHIDERRRLLLKYEENGKLDFWTDVRQSLGRNEFYFLSALYRYGEPPKAEVIWRCVAGLGTNEVRIKEVLAGMTSAEISDLASDFAKIANRRAKWWRSQTLHSRLRSECSGDAWQDISILLQGRPLNLVSEHQRMIDIHKHERSGSLFRRIDPFTKEGAVMDRDVQLADACFNGLFSAGPAPLEQIERFQTLCSFAYTDIVGFRINKNDWAEFIATTTSNIVVIAALISTAGIIETSAHPWLGALFGLGVAAASRGLTRFGIKWRLKGSGYGREEMARDVVVTTVEVMTFFLSRFVPSSLLSKPLDIGARIGLSAFVHHQEIADNDLTPMHAMKVSDMPRLMRLK